MASSLQHPAVYQHIQSVFGDLLSAQFDTFRERAFPEDIILLDRILTKYYERQPRKNTTCHLADIIKQVLE